MKHIRLYNNYLTKNAYPKEVNDIFFYLRRLIKEGDNSIMESKMKSINQ